MQTLLIFFIFFACIHQLKAQDVEVTISNIRSGKGDIRIGVFKDQKSFDDEKAYKNFVFPKQNIQGGTLKISFQIEPGIYGLAVLDDENSDGKMNYNFLGMPREGFGFSNYDADGFSKPKFNDFKFQVKQGKNFVHIKMRYIL